MKPIYFALVLCAVFCSAATVPAQDYILGEGDVITITVYEHPDLKTTTRISGDGRVGMPLIGQISAANISVDEFAEKIKTRLADGYIVNPQVNVFIEEFGSRKATILGEVDSLGLYELRGQTSLLELISKAGGLLASAINRAVIHRKKSVNQEERTIVVDLRRLMQDGESGRNIDIIDGDNIFIPKKEVIYVTGQVKKPDTYNYEEDLTVIQAITMAGGTNDKAAPGRTKIIRSQGGKEQLLKGVKMDQMVKPNDVIVVPESYF